MFAGHPLYGSPLARLKFVPLPQVKSLFTFLASGPVQLDPAFPSQFTPLSGSDLKALN